VRWASAKGARSRGGDFFGSVPAGDLHMLKSVLHDWNDEQALAILRSCRAAVTPGGRVLVLERIIGAPNIAPAEKFGDLNMLVAAGGRERSHEELSNCSRQRDTRSSARYLRARSCI
jgi:hypothetical protein